MGAGRLARIEPVGNQDSRTLIGTSAISGHRSRFISSAPRRRRPGRSGDARIVEDGPDIGTAHDAGFRNIGRAVAGHEGHGLFEARAGDIAGRSLDRRGIRGSAHTAPISRCSCETARQHDRECAARSHPRRAAPGCPECRSSYRMRVFVSRRDRHSCERSRPARLRRSHLRDRLIAPMAAMRPAVRRRL